jgi:hypothetical protein
VLIAKRSEKRAKIPAAADGIFRICHPPSSLTRLTKSFELDAAGATNDRIIEAAMPIRIGKPVRSEPAASFDTLHFGWKARQ